MKIFVIHGPNLNMLGIREKEIYGSMSYELLVNTIKEYCDINDIEVEFFQSNHEGDLVDWIQKAYFDKVDGIVINPGAYTHTSIAILDAVKAISPIPVVEVHLSDVNNREDFRKTSYIGLGCIKTISGKQVDGYKEAIDTLKGLS